MAPRRPAMRMAPTETIYYENQQLLTPPESLSPNSVTKEGPASEGNPSTAWIRKWKKMDLKSAIASQVEFFQACPTFKRELDYSYVVFFMAIHKTIEAAKRDTETIVNDPIARRNLEALHHLYDGFAPVCKAALRDDLKEICEHEYITQQAPNEAIKELDADCQFLKETNKMAFYLRLALEWAQCDKKLQDAKQDTITQVKPPESEEDQRGPITPELREMDYEFAENIWVEWMESCVAYFQHWTSDPKRKVPATDFIRHISHFQLAMELFIKHKSVSEKDMATLKILAKTYMGQYQQYAAVKLESKYADLKDMVKTTNIYKVEASFFDLSEDLEIMMNEVPKDVNPDLWIEAVPALLPQDKVVLAKNAVNVLYKEFQTKRYPEDEVAYLWLLTWKNIKHTLPYHLSPVEMKALEAKHKKDQVIEPRDLAVPFVHDNLTELIDVLRKDNDAYYQKEIESLVGKYCLNIDNYGNGTGPGSKRVYEQFGRLGNVKRVPFVCLVDLEESLLEEEVKPTKSSQVIAHRVVRRLNHIMEGPKTFTRWIMTASGTLKTYSPTSTWVNEQVAQKEKSGGLDFYKDFNTSFSSPPDHSSSGAPGGNGGSGNNHGGSGSGGNDGEGPGSGGDESSSEEEVEEESPGGTKRLMKRKKSKSPKTSGLTKEKLEKLTKLLEDRQSPGSNETTPGSTDEDEEIRPGIHPQPADSLDYHRRRLSLRRIEQPSAFANAQYPLPESAASQRAAALQIARELSNSGIHTDGPRPEDVENYVNPTLRLPLEGMSPSSPAALPHSS
jgi:hypothetical protein